jgi:hypothetical protein
LVKCAHRYTAKSICHAPHISVAAQLSFIVFCAAFLANFDIHHHWHKTQPMTAAMNKNGYMITTKGEPIQANSKHNQETFLKTIQ